MKSENKKNRILDLWNENHEFCGLIRISCKKFKDFKSSIKLIAIFETGYREEVEEVDIFDEIFINYFTLEIHNVLESYIEENDEKLTYIKSFEGEINRESDGFEILLTINTEDGEDELQEFL
jgi:hypothetical protein